jgi:PII-like signaling protein
MEVSQAQVLRLYMGESDKHGAHSLHDWMIYNSTLQTQMAARVLKILSESA